MLDIRINMKYGRSILYPSKSYAEEQAYKMPMPLYIFRVERSMSENADKYCKDLYLETALIIS